MYPAEIRRCQHIKTNGTQCGSPALRNETLCHYHRESRPERVEVCGENGQACGQILVPVFEDASSIQTMVRQVTILLLQGKIDSKKAGQVLYGLQIASANLKRMELEKPRPVQVVVDEEKVAETPLGMTPWSGKESGHEVEEPAEAAAERALREVDARWRKDYREAKEWLEKKRAGLDESVGHTAPKSPDLLERQLNNLLFMMKNRIEWMEERLGVRVQ